MSLTERVARAIDQAEHRDPYSNLARADAAIREVLAAQREWSERVGACARNPDPDFFEAGLVGFEAENLGDRP